MQEKLEFRRGLADGCKEGLLFDLVRAEGENRAMPDPVRVVTYDRGWQENGKDHEHQRPEESRDGVFEGSREDQADAATQRRAITRQ